MAYSAKDITECKTKCAKLREAKGNVIITNGGTFFPVCRDQFLKDIVKSYGVLKFDQP